MSRIVVATNPADDDVTKYLDVWQEQVIKAIRNEGDTQLFELTGEETNKDNLTKLIEKENPQFIIFNGHGNDETIFGFN